ncbi:MAG: hypothetical protein ACWA5K_03085, partial [bacterium]
TETFNLMTKTAWMQCRS